MAFVHELVDQAYAVVLPVFAFLGGAGFRLSDFFEDVDFEFGGIDVAVFGFDDLDSVALVASFGAGLEDFAESSFA